MRLLEAFAGLLEYPGANLPGRVEACVASLTSLPQGGVTCAADALREFKQAAERLGLARLQESYTAAFDLDADCSLDVGHQLFGPDRRRGAFLCRLAGRYQAAGFQGALGEAPDFITSMLRFAESGADPEESAELLADAVAPAAAKVLAALERRQHAYAPVLRALLAILPTATSRGSAGKEATA